MTNKKSLFKTHLYLEIFKHTFLNILSIWSNFLASSGNWDLISPPMKIPSKYIHFLCTTIQTFMYKKTQENAKKNQVQLLKYISMLYNFNKKLV